VTEISCFLKALTPEAKQALGSDTLGLGRFPFRLGRESRIQDNMKDSAESRRRSGATPNNDLYLQENSHFLNVSREHLLIDRREGAFVLVDRGSACGTLVEGTLVGGQRRGGWKQLCSSDVIIVGTSESRFVFKFLVHPSP
jgi:hypothetical protein